MTVFAEDSSVDLWIEGRWEELIPLAQIQATAARRAGDLEQEAEALADLTLLFSETRRPDLAARAAYRELRVRRRLGEPLGIARALSSVAQVLEDLGHCARAIACARKARTAFLHLDLTSRLEMGALGRLFLDAGCPREALEIFGEALVPAPADHACVLRSTVLQCLGITHEALGELPSAILAQHEAVAVWSRARLECATPLVRLADLHLKVGEIWQAAKLLKEAIGIARTHGNQEAAEAALRKLRRLKPSRKPARLLCQPMRFRPC